MKRILTTGTVMVLLLALPLMMQGQNTLKLRISGNSTRFMNEPQGDEIPHPDIDNLLIGGTSTVTQFTHKRELGFEAELMMSLSEKVYVGFEVGQDHFSGDNDTPGLYNFQFTDQLQLFEKVEDMDQTVINYLLTQAPLRYNTNMLNFIGNLRVYPAPGGRFRPFIKVSGGMSLIATELSLKVPPQVPGTLDEETPPFPMVLFSRGTSGSPKGREAALVLGAGIGFELQVTDRIALYADGSYRLVNSNILDGKPNFDWKDNPEWNEENPDFDPNYEWTYGTEDLRGKLEPFTTRTQIGKITFGVVYTLKEGYGKSSRQIGGNVSKGSPYLPFFKLKRL